MVTTSIDSLPDELLHQVLGSFRIARDVAHFSSLTRNTHHFTNQNGWKAFVHNAFPSLSIPNCSTPIRWADVANRLSYQAKCWDRRAFVTRTYAFRQQHNSSHRRTSGQQSVLFHCLLDATTLSSGQELVIWSAGEDIICRQKAWSPRYSDSWGSLQGRASGHHPGAGDVTALSAIELAGSPQMVLGRASGDLQLLSAS